MPNLFGTVVDGLRLPAHRLRLGSAGLGADGIQVNESSLLRGGGSALDFVQTNGRRTFVPRVIGALHSVVPGGPGMTDNGISNYAW